MRQNYLGTLTGLTLMGVAYPLSAQIVNVQQELESRLLPFGKFTVIGRWDGKACALTGIAPKQSLLVADVEGSLPNGISMGGPETVLSVGSIAEDKKTFQNCNSTASQASSNFSATVTKSVSVAFQDAFSTTLSGSLTVSAGVPGYASVALGISGSKTWSTSTTTTQTTAISILMGNSFSAIVPPGQELDITYEVLSKRVRLPISAAGTFDGSFYQCQLAPKKRVSDFLTSSDRTFTASGTIEFDDVQEGTFKVSSPRPTVCAASGVNLVRGQTSLGMWAAKAYALRVLPAQRAAVDH